ncbi:hypothetical protein B0H12DRAFT_1143571 [Mycena haematopus]|nr:hypothetical protein B0H12DRAFT_1143571 [Mycena haematopus]
MTPSTGNHASDTMEDPELNAQFGSVLGKCFLAEYVTGSELLDDMKRARESSRLQSLGLKTADDTTL